MRKTDLLALAMAATALFACGLADEAERVISEMNETPPPERRVTNQPPPPEDAAPYPGPGAEAGGTASDDAPGYACALDKASADVGERVTMRFDKPLPKTPGERYWVALALAHKPDSEWGYWEYVDEGSARIRLPAAREPGLYEARLHANYPTISYNVVCRVRLAVGKTKCEAGAVPPGVKTTLSAGAVSFSLDRDVYPAGASIKIVFNGPIEPSEGNRYWITVVEAGKGDSSWGAYEYVDKGAKSARLRAPSAPGTYEVRLHGDYPKKSHDVLFRRRIAVQ